VPLCHSKCPGLPNHALGDALLDTVAALEPASLAERGVLIARSRTCAESAQFRRAPDRAGFPAEARR
jgi:hypothetical protein